MITQEEKELCLFLLKNKSCYRGAPIRGKQIWGIGKKAITLGFLKSDDGYSQDQHIWCEQKEFHHYGEVKVKNAYTFDDGISVAQEIIEKYGKLDASKNEKWAISTEEQEMWRVHMREMSLIEEKFALGSIPLAQFKIIIKAYMKKQEELFGNNGHYVPNEEVIKRLNQLGYYKNTPGIIIYNYKNKKGEPLIQR